RSAAPAEDESFAMFGGFEAAAGSIGVRIADEENGLVGVADHAQSQIVRGGIFTHHACSDDEEAPAAELHFFRLALFEHDQVERFAQLKVGMLAIRAMGFQIVDFGENAA